MTERDQNKNQNIPNLDIAFSQTSKKASKKSKDSNANRTSIKINKDVKMMFDEAVYQKRSNRIDLLGEIIEDWMKANQPNIYQQYLEGKLPEQLKK